MRMSRRDFLKLTAAVGALAATDSVYIDKALAGNGDPRMVWLQGQGCSGCSVSLLNSITMTTVDDLLLNKVNLQYHSTLIAAAGDVAFRQATRPHPSPLDLARFSSEWLGNRENLQFDQNADGVVNFIDFAALAAQGYILVVEGAIPLGAEGHFCHVGGGMTMVEAFDRFSEKATHVLAIGTCAAYGGIVGAAPNPTEALGVRDALEKLGRSKPVINMPGCPAHPDWFVGTALTLLAEGRPPELDGDGRPTAYYGTKVHSTCPLRDEPRARTLGEQGCLIDLGCKGKRTYADCPYRKWNSGAPGATGVNWCVGARTPCHGCTEADFPDGKTPFYNL